VATLQLTAARVDLDSRIVDRAGSERRLTSREADLLRYLSDRAGITVSRDELLREVWGYRQLVFTRAVDHALARLRRKVERNAQRPDHLVSDYGEGVRFVGIGDAEVGGPEASVELALHETSFVGRKALLQDLDAASRRAPLVTLLGPAGAGKTRLAVQFARSWSTTCFVSLQAAEDADGIAALLANALELPGGAGVVQIGRAIRERGEILILLDSAERVAEQLPSVLDALLSSTPEARWICTSQVRLRLVQEEVLHVPPMSLAESVELLRDRIHEPGLSDAALKSMAQSVERLPLTLEVVAGHVGEGGFDGSTGAYVGEQRSLGDVVAWAWGCVEQDHSALLRLASPPGGVDATLAEALLGPGALDVVQMGVDHSLLHSWSPPGLDGLRFAPFDAVRAYLQGLSGWARAEHDAVRVLSPELGRLGRLEARHERAAAAEARAALVAELANLRWVVGHAAADPASRARCASALVDHAMSGQRFERACELAEAALAVCPESERGRLWGQLGHGWLYLGRPRASRELVDRALRSERSAGLDPRFEEQLLRIEALSLRAMGRPGAAEAALREALAFAEVHHIAVGVAACHGNLGVFCLLRGDLASAQRHLRRAWVLATELSRHDLVARVLHSLAGTQVLEGQDALAAATFERSRRSALICGKRWFAAGQHAATCSVWISLDRVQEAARGLDRAERDLRELGVDPQGSFELQTARVELALRLGDVVCASELLAKRSLPSDPETHSEAQWLCLRARVRVAVGDTDAARRDMAAVRAFSLRSGAAERSVVGRMLSEAEHALATAESPGP